MSVYPARDFTNFIAPTKREREREAEKNLRSFFSRKKACRNQFDRNFLNIVFLYDRWFKGYFISVFL